MNSSFDQRKDENAVESGRPSDDAPNLIKPSRRGGKRPGAGRKPGSLSKRTIILNEAMALEEQRDPNLKPLDYMLRVMQDPKQTQATRMAAAQAAAPYVHPRLAAMAVRSSANLTLEQLVLASMSDEQPQIDRGNERVRLAVLDRPTDHESGFQQTVSPMEGAHQINSGSASGPQNLQSERKIA